jgi:hypothetical protein
MLDQGTSRAGKDFSIVDFMLLARHVAAKFLGTINDGVHRHSDALLEQAVV